MKQTTLMCSLDPIIFLLNRHLRKYCLQRHLSRTYPISYFDITYFELLIRHYLFQLIPPLLNPTSIHVSANISNTWLQYISKVTRWHCSADNLLRIDVPVPF